jgi:hypothetical protein
MEYNISLEQLSSFVKGVLETLLELGELGKLGELRELVEVKDITSWTCTKYVQKCVKTGYLH